MLATTTQTRRRWFPRSFGMRTLLVLIVVLALPLAWITKERRQSQGEREIADELCCTGAIVTQAGPYDA